MNKVPIGDLIDLQYGKSLRKDKRIIGDFPVFGSNGIVDYHNEYQVKGPTIIIGRKGSIGEVWLSQVPCWPIDTTYYVVPKKEVQLDIVWFSQILNTLGLSRLNRAAAIPGLNRNDVYQIKIPFPPLDDQKRIASLLTRVEKLIARRKESIQLLDELLKSAFLEMFGDPVRNEKGWESNEIENLCNEIIDCPHSTPIYSDENTGYYCIRSSDIVNGYLDLSMTFQVDLNVYEERIKRYTPIINDIVYSREGGRLGNAARIKEDKPVCLGQRIMLFKTNKDNESDFLWALLESQAFKRKIQNLVGGGAAPRINIKDLKKIIVIQPPKTNQIKFSQYAIKIDTLKLFFQHSLTELENLYGSLSQKAFKGELDLSRIPLPEEEPIDSKKQTNPSDEDLKALARKALSDLNLFNQNKEALSALKDAISSVDLNSSALIIAREMAEQATLWKTPIDELKNISSIARSLAEISKPSSALQKIVAEQTASIQHTAKIAEEIGKSIPQIDFSFVAQQKDLIESAMKPFSQMQQNIANLTAPLKGLQDTIGVLSQYDGVLPPSVAAIIDNELEPKHIFTSFDILDILSDRNQLSFLEILEMLSKLEEVDIVGYERIKKLLYELLQNGIVQQTFDEEKKEMLLSVNR